MYSFVASFIQIQLIEIRFPLHVQHGDPVSIVEQTQNHKEALEFNK